MDEDNPTHSPPSYHGPKEDLSTKQDDLTQRTESTTRPLSFPAPASPLAKALLARHPFPPAQTSLPVSETASSSVLVSARSPPLAVTFAHSPSLTPASAPVSESILQTSFAKPQSSDHKLHCKECDYNFGSRRNYIRHQEKYHQLSCEICDILFDQTQAYQEHTKRVHELQPPSKLECPDCHYLFLTETSLDQHCVVKHDKERTVTHYELKIQQPSTVPDKENILNYCAACEYTFSGPNEFNAHLARTHHLDISLSLFPITEHYPDAPLDPDHPLLFCTRCDFTFAEYLHFDKHLEIMHGLNGRKNGRKSIRNIIKRSKYCVQCDKEFATTNIYTSHQRYHKYPQSQECCHLCLLGFSTKKNYDYHMKYSHQIDLLQPAIPTEEIPTNLYCDICNRTLCNERSYVRHTYSDAHKLKVYLLENYPDYPDNPENHCEECDLSFDYKTRYHRHLLFMHQVKLPRLHSLPKYINYDIVPTTDDPNNHCTACDRTYSHRNKYREHLLQIHHLEVPYDTSSTTTKTKKGTSSSSSIKKSEPSSSYSSTTITPCEKQRSSSRIRLRDKIKKETIELFCTICQTQFTSKTELSHHTSTFHKHDNLPDPNDPNLHCSTCDLEFPSTLNFRRHLNQEHGMNLPITERRANTIVTNKKPNFHDPDQYCAPCDRILASPYTFRNHMFRFHKLQIEQDHTVKSVFCEICRHQYVSRHKYDEHMKKHHSEKQQETSSSSSSSSSRRSNKRKYVNLDVVPEMDNSNYQCTACDYVYTDRAAYRAHFRNIHGLDTPIPPWDNNNRVSHHGSKPQRSGKRVKSEPTTPDIHNKKFYCATCDHRYSSESNYKTHLQKFHNVFIPPKTLPKLPSYINLTVTPEIDRSDNLCTACNRMYHSKHSLRQHLTDIHKMKLAPLKRKTYINRSVTPEIDHPQNRCTACNNRKYSSQHSLRQHLIDIHHMKLPSKKNPSSLPAYINASDTPDIEHPHNHCTACKRKYSSKHSLRRHLVDIHQMDLPLYGVGKNAPKKKKCSVCDDSFFTQSMYDRHVVQEHGAEFKEIKLEVSKRRVASLRERRNLESSSNSSSSSSRQGTKDKTVVRIVYGCFECDTTCPSKETLKEHLIREHDMLLPVRAQYKSPEERATNKLQKRKQENMESEEDDDDDDDKEQNKSNSYDDTSSEDEREESSRSCSPEEKQTVPEEKAVDSRMKKCNECGEGFTDNLLYQLHVVQAHDVKVRLPSRKRVKFNLPVVQSVGSGAN